MRWARLMCTATQKEHRKIVMRHYWMLAGVWAIMIVGQYSSFMVGILQPGSVSPMPAVVTGLCLSLAYQRWKGGLW